MLIELAVMPVLIREAHTIYTLTNQGASTHNQVSNKQGILKNSTDSRDCTSY